jgi:aldose sugar dehydrogenase
VVGGLNFPTSMAFLGTGDILVLENTGQLRRIMNRTLLHEPILEANVVNDGERGMLGIAVSA